MNKNRLFLLPCTLLVFMIALFGCAGGQKSSAPDTDKEAAEIVAPESQPAIDVADVAVPEKQSEQSQQKKSQKVQRREQVRIEGQYLRVKFNQNDTEVDLVLDPNSTNLALDLKRGPDGFLEVTRGDSTIFDTNSEKAEELVGQLGDLGDQHGFEHLTDDIIQDISQAQKMFYQQRYDDAIDILKASLQKKQTATAYALGGSIYYVNGDIEQAVMAWENALKINPEMNEVRDLLVRYKN
jgi:tetratricopeptide (TPR) repeat protein